MMRLSITTRVTIWYIVFMLIIVGCFITVMIYTGNIRASEQARTKLMDAVADASEEIEKDGEDFIIDEHLHFYDDGVYISVYGEDGTLIEGRRPADVSDLPELDDKSIEQIRDDKGEIWYVYDSLFEMGATSIWVRGIVKDFAEGSAFSFMIRLSLVALPALVLLAALGGFAVTKRGFRPIRKIIATAEEISRDGDLSKRIELGKGKDEIHDLAVTFNGMFEKLDKTFKEEKQFTSDVSHELRTPLSVIISQSDYAIEDEGYREKALRTINAEARRMSGLVNRLLTLSRSDAGRLELEWETLNLSDICENIAEQQGHLAGEKGITLISEIEPGIMVSGDELMLMRVVMNLVDNAVKYGCTADRADNVIRLEVYRDEDAAYCTVEDNGPGISEEHLDRIWERFYRVNRSRNADGAGLGLSMVKSLVLAHGGEVRAESKVGKGSKFTVKLPLFAD